jgi:anti-anti-sigma factor
METRADMRWIIEWREGYTVLRFEGDLMVGATQFFEAGVRAWLKMPFPPIVLDLSDMKIIASAGLSSLVKLQKAIAEAEVEVVVVKPSEEAWQALVLTRLDRLFTFADSIEQAAEAVADRSS